VSQNPAGRPSPLSALPEAERTRWMKVLGPAEALSCDDTPVDFGKADASAAFASIDDLREQCDGEHLKPLRSMIRSIRSDTTPVYSLDESDAARLAALVERAVEATSAALEPVWRGEGSPTMRRWRGADGIQELIRALKDRCL
jgi:hypothetical protein